MSLSVTQCSAQDTETLLSDAAAARSWAAVAQTQITPAHLYGVVYDVDMADGGARDATIERRIVSVSLTASKLLINQTAVRNDSLN